MHRRLLQQALEAARSCQDRALELDALQAWAGFVNARGELAEARATQERALALARALGAARHEALALARLGADRVELGDPEGVAMVRAAVDVAARMGARSSESYALERLGLVLGAQGHWREGFEAASRAFRVALEHGYITLADRASAMVVEYCCLLGDTRAADDVVRCLEAVPEWSPGHMSSLSLSCMRSSEGAHEIASAILEREMANAVAVESPRRIADVGVAQGQVALDAGDVASAAEKAAASARATPLDCHVTRARAHVLWAAIASERGEWQDANRALMRAGEAAEEARDLAVMRQIRFEAALLAVVSGDLARGMEALESVVAELEEQGGVLHAIAAALTARAHRRPPPSFDEITSPAVRALLAFVLSDVPFEALDARARRVERAARAFDVVCSEERTLVVATDGRFIEIGGKRTDLVRQRAMRLILLALVDRHRREALTLDEVVSAGWPGEKIHPESAATRVYTTIRRLRQGGLGAALLTRDDGYLLDPRITIIRREDSR
jgi:hypothetical protein